MNISFPARAIYEVMDDGKVRVGIVCVDESVTTTWVRTAMCRYDLNADGVIIGITWFHDEILDHFMLERVSRLFRFRDSQTVAKVIENRQSSGEFTVEVDPFSRNAQREALARQRL